MTMNGFELLASYRMSGSETAFTELLRHYTNLVYSVARRRLVDESLAEDVTQAVFIRLARTPPPVKSDGELAAWLHRTAIHVAIDVWRSETRRQAREQKAFTMQPSPADDAQFWTEMSPQLDEALNQLADDDRQALLLRFFERKPMREIGSALGVSEDAAKMRVGRALERLRGEFARRGAACTAVLLAAVLTERAVEAAPAHLLPRLIALNMAAPAATVAGGIFGATLLFVRSKLVFGAAAILVAGTVVLLLADHSGKPGEAADHAATDPVRAKASANNPTETPAPKPLIYNPNRMADATVAAPAAGKFTFRVVDKETGIGIPDARIRAAYFYAGGVGERHLLQSDKFGNTPIPEPDKPLPVSGLNVFSVIEGYVPKAVSFHELSAQTNFVLELERAVAVGGVVVDEQALPVAGVELEARTDVSDVFSHKGEPNTDFQTCKVTTDANGRWYFPYVPKSYAAIHFYLTCSNYAVADLAVLVGKPESLNAILIIERGFTVLGRVTDAAGRPVAGATIKETQNFGYRKLTAVSDHDGYYSMHGLGVPPRKMLDFTDPLNPKTTSAASEQTSDLVVQADGMAPQHQMVQLAQPTNYVDFTLAKSPVFRGRIVNEGGNPIAGAVIRTDWDFQNQVPDRYEWLTHSDADGRFSWDSAPAETISFWFEADGYEIIRDTKILPDGTDHEIRLTRTKPRDPGPKAAQNPFQSLRDSSVFQPR